MTLSNEQIQELLRVGNPTDEECRLIRMGWDAAMRKRTAMSVPEVTDAMALAFHHALTDGSIGAREVEEIKTGLRAALAAAQEANP